MSSLGIRIVDGNWVVVSGNIVIANYLLAKITLNLKTTLGSWLYDTTIGSQVPSLNSVRQTLTKEQIKTVMSAAFTPLEQSGEISDVNIVLTYFGLSYYIFDISCIDSTGEEIKFSYSTKD